jgi:hypothetical protein
MAQTDIKLFIDFFHDATKRIRNEKALFVRGKDGNLVKLALNVFSRPQLEMLALWFLAHKTKMQATIGAMLSRAVMEELEKQIARPSFWKDVDAIYDRYFERPTPSPDHESFSLDDIRELKKRLTF